MEDLQFSETINTPSATVWNILWDDATYRTWTAPFSQGSHALSDWKQGSEVLFLGPGKEGEEGGMYSVIETLIPNQEMDFRHIGEVRNGIKQPPTPEWDGAHETYTLSENNGVTTLSVVLTKIPDEHVSFMSDAFPKALTIVKELSEKS